GASACVTCTPGCGSVPALARLASGYDGVEVVPAVGREATGQGLRSGRHDELLKLLRVRLQLLLGVTRETLGQGRRQLELGRHVVEQDLTLQRLDLAAQVTGRGLELLDRLGLGELGFGLAELGAVVRRLRASGSQLLAKHLRRNRLLLRLPLGRLRALTLGGLALRGRGVRGLLAGGLFGAGGLDLLGHWFTPPGRSIRIAEPPGLRPSVLGG